MEKISPALLNLLLNASWQVAIVAAAAELSTRLLRGLSARERHRIWVAALLLSIALPLFNIAKPLPLAFRHLKTTPHTAAQTPATPAMEVTPLAYTNATDDVVTAPVTPAQRNFAMSPRAAMLAIAVYLVFVLFRVVGLFRAWWSMRRMIRSARAAEMSDSLRRVLARCLEQTRIGRLRVLVSDAISSPMTLGLAPALVVLPDKLLREEDEAILTSALGHELVHIDRNDYVLNLVYRLLLIPLSFHPAALFIQRRIEQTRELRCDEVVTERLLSPAAYARSLVELAGRAIQRPAATVAVGIADADILEERIMSMLKKPQLSSAKRALLLSGAALVFAVPCIAAAPYALHVNVQNNDPQPAIATGAPAAPAVAKVAFKAQPVIAAAVPRQETQTQKAEPKERENYMVVLPAGGFSYTPDGQNGESAARMKRKLEESQLTPEQRQQIEERARKENAERVRYLSLLSKTAKITIQQAIDAATREVPGTVLESGLTGERLKVIRQPDGTDTRIGDNLGNPFYRIVILAGDENNPERHIVFVDAITGNVVRSVVE